MSSSAIESIGSILVTLAGQHALAVVTLTRCPGNTVLIHLLVRICSVSRMQQVVAQKGSCLDLDRDLELALLSEDAGDLLRLLLLCLPFSFTASDDCLGLIGSAFVCMPNMLLMMYSHVILPYCTSPQIHYHTIQYYKHCMRSTQGNFHARHACHVVRFAGLFDAMLPT